MLVRIANREDPDQTAASECFRSSLIWVCAVFNSEAARSGSALFVYAFLAGK